MPWRSTTHWSAADTFAKTPPGYIAFSVSRYALCLLVMLPSTFCAGITLPLITRVLLSRGSGERAVGRVYGVKAISRQGGREIVTQLELPEETWLTLREDFDEVS